MCALSAQDLDLSCNNIGALANLGTCRQLTRLDLSNNCLLCLARAQQMCGGLRRLVLRVCSAACCFVGVWHFAAPMSLSLADTYPLYIKWLKEVKLPQWMTGVVFLLGTNRVLRQLRATPSARRPGWSG